jgi:glycosyltransferase involved in cell wall biosynthesis
MKVSLYTSWQTKCGVADYSCSLKAALERTGAAVEIVPVPARKWIPDIMRLGGLMNSGDVAHVQFEYSFFSSTFPIISGVNCCLFLRRISVPAVITVHEVFPPATRPQRYFHRRIYRTLSGLVDRVTVHTEKHRAMLADLGVDVGKLLIVPMPIPDVTSPPGTRQQCKEMLHLEGRPVLTLFGFINRRKGYELAMDAFKGIDDCVLLIAGGSAPGDRSGYYEELEKRVRERGMADRVKMLGYLPEEQIPIVMGATDIILAPFHDMPGSASLSMGVAFHKPIIGSDIDQMKELGSRGMGIEFFRRSDAGDLREKIIELKRNPGRQADLEQLSKSYAAAYSYGNTALRLRELYASLAGR